jgi:hypothetical protein
VSCFFVASGILTIAASMMAWSRSGCMVKCRSGQGGRPSHFDA